MRRLVRRVLISILVSAFIYIGICFTLVFWPAPPKKNVKNYDYSSLGNPKINNGEERWLTLRDKSKLFYRFYPSDAKRILIFIHGSGAESRYLGNFASFISGKGLAQVITPDLRGHGRTSMTKGDIDYLGQFDDDIEDIVLYSKQTYPGSKIIVGGHSSGGGLALRYEGNKSVKDVDGYLLFAPYLAYNAPTTKPNSGEWVTVALKRIIGLSMLNNLGFRNFNGMPVLFFNRPEEWNDDLQAQSYSYRLLMSFQPRDYPEEIKQIHQPTLVVVGSLDESFYADQFPVVFKGAGTTKTIIVEGANHLGIVDNEEAEINVSSWLKQF